MSQNNDRYGSRRGAGSASGAGAASSVGSARGAAPSTTGAERTPLPAGASAASSKVDDVLIYISIRSSRSPELVIEDLYGQE